MSTRTPVGRMEASLALLNSLVEHAVDDDYAASAERASLEAATARAASDMSGPGGPGHEGSGSPDTPWGMARRRRGPGLRTDVRPVGSGVWLLMGVVVAGLVLASAINGVRSTRDAVSAERAGLAEQVRQSSLVASALEKRVTELQRDIAALGAENVRGTTAQAEAQVLRLGEFVGAVAVTGPGIVLRMEDSEEQDAATGTGRVLDIDVQRVVNGVWAAGATAVSIGGQRLTPLTAIRSANDVVLVNYRPLPPPYEITALGDPEALRRDILEGSAGEWLEAIAVSDGIRYSLRTQDEVTVPASEVSLRHAEPVIP